MRKSLVVLLGAFFCMSLSLVASSEGRAETITLRFANVFPPVHKNTLLVQEWGKEVEKRTDGRVKVVSFPGGSLVGGSEMFDAVETGIADIGDSFCSYTRGRFPLTEVLDLPLGYQSGYIATKMANAYFDKFKPKEFDSVKLVYLHTSPPHRLNMKMPVRNLEDLRGRKIRATGTSAKVMQALGAAPVAMSMGEAYDALKKGVTEGVTAPFEALKGWKLADVVKYTTVYGSAYVNTAYVVMNKNKWESLPQDIKDTIEQINKEYMEKQGRLWDELDEGGREALLEAKGEIIPLSQEENARWTSLIRPILDEYVQNKKAMGLPAEEALQFCLDYLKAHQQ